MSQRVAETRWILFLMSTNNGIVMHSSSSDFLHGFVFLMTGGFWIMCHRPLKHELMAVMSCKRSCASHSNFSWQKSRVESTRKEHGDDFMFFTVWCFWSGFTEMLTRDTYVHIHTSPWLYENGKVCDLHTIVVTVHLPPSTTSFTQHLILSTQTTAFSSPSFAFIHIARLPQCKRRTPSSLLTIFKLHYWLSCFPTPSLY